MIRLLAIFLLLATPAIATAQSDEGTLPGGFLDRILEPAGEGKDELPDRPPMVIVLDPGHGGADRGAVSPRQGIEKSVTLRLAILIEQELIKKKTFRVVMTRNDDTPLTPVERLDIANGSDALMMVSLHAAGGARPVTRPLHIFVNDPIPPSDTRRGKGWKYQANRFDRANRRLAEGISSGLKDFYGDERGIEIVPTDRLFLGGANLPTVLVEGIDLAGPVGVTLPDDDDGMKKLAAALAGAIRSVAQRESGYGY